MAGFDTVRAASCCAGVLVSAPSISTKYRDRNPRARAATAGRDAELRTALQRLARPERSGDDGVALWLNDSRSNGSRCPPSASRFATVRSWLLWIGSQRKLCSGTWRANSIRSTSKGPIDTFRVIRPARPRLPGPMPSVPAPDLPEAPPGADRTSVTKPSEYRAPAVSHKRLKQRIQRGRNSSPISIRPGVASGASSCSSWSTWHGLGECLQALSRSRCHVNSFRVLMASLPSCESVRERSAASTQN